jgi:hypothetical protein
MIGDYMFTRPKQSTIEVVAPKEEKDSIGAPATHFLLVHFTTLVV